MQVSKNKTDIGLHEQKLSYFSVKNDVISVNATLKIITKKKSGLTIIDANGITVEIEDKKRIQLNANDSRGKLVVWDGTGTSTVLMKTWSNGVINNEFASKE
jgi:hypothetical protein